MNQQLELDLPLEAVPSAFIVELHRDNDLVYTSRLTHDPIIAESIRQQLVAGFADVHWELTPRLTGWLGLRSDGVRGHVFRCTIRPTESLPNGPEYERP